MLEAFLADDEEADALVGVAALLREDGVAAAAAAALPVGVAARAGEEDAAGAALDWEEAGAGEAAPPMLSEMVDAGPLVVAFEVAAGSLGAPPPIEMVFGFSTAPGLIVLPPEGGGRTAAAGVGAGAAGSSLSQSPWTGWDGAACCCCCC